MWQHLIELSQEDENKNRPSGLTHTLVTPREWPSKVETHEEDDRSHILIVLSSEDENKNRPSGLTHTLVTSEEWPSKVETHEEDDRSHIFIVASNEDENKNRPSGLTHTLVTYEEWPCKSAIKLLYLSYPPSCRQRIHESLFAANVLKPLDG